MVISFVAVIVENNSIPVILINLYVAIPAICFFCWLILWFGKISNAVSIKQQKKSVIIA